MTEQFPSKGYCGANVVGKYFAVWRLPKLPMCLCEFCVEQDWESHNAKWQKPLTSVPDDCEMRDASHIVMGVPCCKKRDPYQKNWMAA